MNSLLEPNGYPPGGKIWCCDSGGIKLNHSTIAIQSARWSALEQDKPKENQSRARALSCHQRSMLKLFLEIISRAISTLQNTAKAEHGNAEISDLIKEQLLLLLSAITTVKPISIQMVSLSSET